MEVFSRRATRTEHTIDGYESVATGDTQVVGRVHVSPVDGPVLVREVTASLATPASPSTPSPFVLPCTRLGPFPLVVDVPTFVTVTCEVPGEVPPGATLTVRVDDGSGTPATGSTPPANEITIDVKPGSHRNPIQTKQRGVVPVAVLSANISSGGSIRPSVSIEVPFSRRAARPTAPTAVAVPAPPRRGPGPRPPGPPDRPAGRLELGPG